VLGRCVSSRRSIGVGAPLICRRNLVAHHPLRRHTGFA
jgi:hypothetical protein